MPLFDIPSYVVYENSEKDYRTASPECEATLKQLSYSVGYGM